MGLRFYSLVAIHAGEHRPMNGIFEVIWIYMQALLLAVHFFGQSGIGVAGEAVVVGRLFCGERVARGKQEER